MQILLTFFMLKSNRNRSPCRNPWGSDERSEERRGCRGEGAHEPRRERNGGRRSRGTSGRGGHGANGGASGRPGRPTEARRRSSRAPRKPYRAGLYKCKVTVAGIMAGSAKLPRYYCTVGTVGSPQHSTNVKWYLTNVKWYLTIVKWHLTNVNYSTWNTGHPAPCHEAGRGSASGRNATAATEQGGEVRADETRRLPRSRAGKCERTKRDGCHGAGAGKCERTKRDGCHGAGAGNASRCRPRRPFPMSQGTSGRGKGGLGRQWRALPPCVVAAVAWRSRALPALRSGMGRGGLCYLLFRLSINSRRGNEAHEICMKVS